MENLLSDIELDIQELKCLVQALPGDTKGALRAVAQRNIGYLRQRLDQLSRWIDEEYAPCPSAPVAPAAEACTASAVVAAPVPQPDFGPSASEVEKPVSSPVPSQAILGERIKPGLDLTHALSLNDTFRFARELFDGDAARLNALLRRMGSADTLADALEAFHAEVYAESEEEKVASAELEELLKRYFD